MKFEMPRPIAQQQGADAIGGIVDRDHRQRIDQPAAGDADRDVEPPDDGRQHHQQQVQRQRDEAHADADAEGDRDRAPVQRPQVRIGEPLAKDTQVPLVAARVDQARYVFD
jgi:septal ring-binding cell division protein DamX